MADKTTCKSMLISERISLITPSLIEEQANGENVRQWLDRKGTIDSEKLSVILSINHWSWEAFDYAIDPHFTLHDVEFDEAILREIFQMSDGKASQYPKEDSYVVLLMPFLDKFVSQCNSIMKSSSVSFSTKTIQSLTECLVSRLFGLSLKVFVYELNLTKSQEYLEGNTPEARFISFINRYKQRETLLNLYAKYPVLARRMLVMTNNFILYVTELIHNLNYFSSTCNGILPTNEPCLHIEDIVPGRGDSHEKGKTVAIIETNKGKIIYKPRDLRIEKTFNKAVEFFSQAPGFASLRLTKSYYSDSFTFSEYIEQKDCTTEAEVCKYYYRYGELIALMYLLNGNDVHYENVIACGEFPVIIDLETLFANAVGFETSIPLDTSLTERMRTSVASSIMLPSKMRIDAHGNIVDLSGVSGQGGPISKREYQPKDLLTDNARFELAEIVLPSSNNEVRLNGKTVNYQHYYKEIEFGFLVVLNYFLANKDSFVDLVGEFDDYRSRTLVRDTNKYAQLLTFTRHPACLKDYIEVEKVLENLYSYPVSSKEICLCEYKDMLFDDIPIFYSSLDSRDLFHSSGKAIEQVFTKTPRETLVEKLQSIDAICVTQQIGLIRMKLRGTDGMNTMLHIDSLTSHKGENAVNSSGYFHLAKAIADNIASSTYMDAFPYAAQWLTIMNGEVDDYDYGPMRSDFYDGVAGIALLFGSLYSITKEEKYRDFAVRCVVSSCGHPILPSTDSAYIGFHSLAKLSPIVSSLSSIPASDAWGLYLDNLNQYHRSYLTKQHEPDCLVGSGGIISCYLELYKLTKDSQYLEYAFALFNKEYVSCVSIDNLGIGHGLSGILISLVKLFQATEDKRVAKKILEINSMLELVFLKHQYTAPFSWCNGHIGYLLSQHFLSQAGLTNECDESRLATLHSELDKVKYSSDCICHGECGRINYYFDSALITGSDRLLSKAQELTKRLMLRIEDSSDIRIKYFEGFPNFGLFTGLAGIAYTLLRTDPSTNHALLLV